MRKIIYFAMVLLSLAFITGCRSTRSGTENPENMPALIVKKVVFECTKPSVAEVAAMFDREKIAFHYIDVINWERYNYKPDVKFRIAHSAEEIYIQYVVKEEGVRATFGYDAGSKPYSDSCVEFFMIPSDKDSIYYNLEMNCIGHGTFAGGPDRKQRTRFGDDVISQIRRHSTLGSEPFGDLPGQHEWTLTIAIPKSIYSLSEFSDLSGRTVKANFYKCGDDMAVPHYLSWHPISIPSPNFHTPEHFGQIFFE
ncbi:MAG TPA: carbohydrate-binding family 9-like protein [Bacteroidales bacterium]|jgi:hypothetical protein|nr:carbohydrate-binding family 9-like protein [Bacteroidales bacterium]